MKGNFAYNKSSIQNFQRQLKVRQTALPVLLRKETALRQMIAKVKPILAEAEDTFEAKRKELEKYERIWNEFPTMLKVSKVHSNWVNIAGTKVERFEKVEFKVDEYNPLYEPVWLPAALDHLKEFIELKLKTDYFRAEKEALELARKKTTQKVNLYEKVQIPYFEESIRKIKRFLEDKENIATAASKIVKNRKAAAR